MKTWHELRDYENLEAFYAERGGERSPEKDFGVWWYRPDSQVPYRVSWVGETGDLYAKRWDDEITLLGRFKNEDEVDETLAGWAHMCGASTAMNSMDWLLARLDERGILGEYDRHE